MDPELFAGPRDKLERAAALVANLQESERAYAAAPDTGSFEWRDAPDGWREFVFQLNRRPPKEAVWDASDAIQNMRQALDLAVSATAIATGVAVPRRAAFQFSDTEAEWDNLADRTMADAPITARATVRRFRPWRGGNEVLKALNELSNEDKHRVVSSVAGVANGFELGNAQFGGGEIELGLPWRPDTRVLPIARVRNGAKFNAQGIRVSGHFAVGNVGRLRGAPLIQLLQRTHAECVAAVQALSEVEL